MPPVSFPPGPQWINTVGKDPALSLRGGPWGCPGLPAEMLPSGWGLEGLILLAELDMGHWAYHLLPVPVSTCCAYAR